MAAPGPLAQRVNAALRRVPAWPLYGLGAAYAAWWFWQAATGAIGVEPVNLLERRYGRTALQLLVATLAVTPIRRLAGVNLLKFRRALGLLAFAFLVAHLLVWALLDVRMLSAMGADILKRPYVTVGMAAFLLLVPLALTSNDASLRRMGGAAWRRLHRLAYPAALLGAVHWVWLARGFAIEPLVYLGAVLALLALRLPTPRPART